LLGTRSGSRAGARRRRADGAHAIEPERTEARHPECNMLCDISQRVAALIAIGGRVGQFAAADAVEHEEDDAGKGVNQGKEFDEK
jgi:hypothetical protein